MKLTCQHSSTQLCGDGLCPVWRIWDAKTRHQCPCVPQDMLNPVDHPSFTILHPGITRAPAGGVMVNGFRLLGLRRRCHGPPWVTSPTRPFLRDVGTSERVARTADQRTRHRLNDERAGPFSWSHLSASATKRSHLNSIMAWEMYMFLHQGAWDWL